MSLMLGGRLLALIKSGGRSDAIRRPPATDAYGNSTIAWQPGEALMQEHNRAVLARRIEQLVGVSPAHFEELYGEAMRAFADFVQGLPASEAHHHARLGGLLDHSLDVAERALTIRRAHLLPPNRAPEIGSRQADLWTYGVFLAALLHDVGKPATDLKVGLYGAEGQELGMWCPALGPIRCADRYYVEFCRERRYRDHERIAPFLVRALLPTTAIEWLSSDGELMTAWLATLGGDYERAGVLGAIVTQADGQSVAADIGADPGARISSARKVPLNEQLLMALRQLLEVGEIRLNRPGAPGWATGTDLWLVSKAALDQMRAWLIDQGQTGVPNRNERLMDELQQHGICMPNGDRAIWPAEVSVEDFCRTFTMLRIPLPVIWPDSERWPAPLDGQVRPLTDGSGSKEIASPATTSADTAEASTRASTPSDMSRGSSEAKAKRDWDAIADGFLGWLVEGIGQGALVINEPAAAIHTVEEGLLLVSPKIFKKYDADYVAVQKALESKRVTLRNTSGTNIIYYDVQSDHKKQRGLKGFVIRNPESVLEIELPAPNPRLKRTTSPGGRV